MVLLGWFCLSAHSLIAQPSINAPETNASISSGFNAYPLIEFLDEKGPAEALWSVIIRDVDSGETLLSHNPAIIRPASNLKLITSGAFLDILGSDHRIQTRIWLVGEQKGDSWNGDLIIEGRGDPSIGAKYTSEDPLEFFHGVRDALQKRGIRKLNGSLIGNHSFFDDQAYPIGWSWDDFSYYYAVQNGALSYRENTVGLVVDASGEVGSVPSISWEPFQTSYVQFVNDQEISPAGSDYDEGYHRRAGSNQIFLTSKLPQGMIEKEDLSIHDPASYFMAVMYEYLVNQGFEITGAPLTEGVSRDWSGEFMQLLLTHESPELSVLVKEMNQESSNFVSEMLAKYVAAYTLNEQGTTEKGLKIIRDHLGSLGVDTAKVDLDDASGLAGSNLISSDEINRFLLIMRNHPEWETFEQSLAVNGENGTLKRRFAENGTTGIFKGKTGYISGVRTLSGFLRAKSGNEYAVTIASNNFIAKVREIDQLHNELMVYLYDQLP